MKPTTKKTPYKRIVMVFTLCILIVLGTLGAGTSLAWFMDTAPENNNIFHFSNFDLKVSHRLSDGKWEKIDSETKIFDEEALYEPGYLQVVYLKVENKGTVPLKFFTAVNVNGYTAAINLFGNQFLLQDYLKFGITVNDTEEKMNNSLANRQEAVKTANMPLHNYSTEVAVLKPNGVSYIALVVRMPEETGNIANYRGNTAPKVELGITIKADQIKD